MDRLVRGAIVSVAVVAAVVAVVTEADGWADYVVLSVFLMTTLGFAIAVAPKIYARRNRTISRSSEKGPS